ncbi:MAG: NADH-quinone oxidoreductase subunit L, partial [Chloroflexi bacterium]|nr:NADH-quinone oxidoreductase subunit L [Chloroflexota bacterium]
TVGGIVFWAGLVGAFLTAIYIFRAFSMTFHGASRAVQTAHDEHGHERPHESPLVMVAPMLLLALLALGSWVVNAPSIHRFADILGAEAEPVQATVAGLSVAAAVLGIGLATLLYQARARRPEAAGRAFVPLHAIVARKYFMDDLYERVLVRRVLYRGLWAALAWFDARVVDGIVDLVGWFGRNVGRGIARIQTGQVQTYAAVFTLGLLLIFAAYLVWGVAA